MVCEKFPDYAWYYQVLPEFLPIEKSEFSFVKSNLPAITMFNYSRKPLCE